MKNTCPSCGDTGVVNELPTISYKWDEQRGAEEIIYSTECQCVNCGHAWCSKRRGNYRIAGEVLDEQREKLDLLWEFYELMMASDAETGFVGEYITDTTRVEGRFYEMAEALSKLWDLRQNAIKVAAERKQEGGA